MPGSSYQSQCRALRLGVYAVILALIAYIGWLQLAENEEMNHWSERQQKRLNYVPGKRGAIVDRNGVPLNYDIATYDIAIHIERLRDPRDTRKATINKVSAAVAELASMLGPDSNGIVFPPRILSCHGNESIPMKPSPRRSGASVRRTNPPRRIPPCGRSISRSSSDRAASNSPATTSCAARTVTSFSRPTFSPTGMKRSKRKRPCPDRTSR